ncbi:MAG: hypothetical protein EPO25_04945 [Gammaproteobacteria bacterium]|nr:MAG: hypothetical protein EPO25_04945 [Gammaproteobacteria bacterium]
MERMRSVLLRYAAVWLVPAALLVALLLAECLLRLFPQMLPEDAQIRRLWLLQDDVRSIGDPYFGFRYPPHFRTELQSLDFRVSIETDEHGFRNASPWPEQADIVVAGDSMAYGYGVELEDSWITLLERQLAGGHVITLGLPGTGPQQNYRYLERFGVGLRPQVVVFTIFPGNDFDGAESFQLWLEAGSPGNYDVWRFFEGRVPGRHTDLLRGSHLWLLLKSLARSIDQPSGRTIKLEGGARLQLAPAIYRSSMERNDPASPAFQAVVDATVAARDLAQANGSRFLAVLFPTKESVYLPLYGQPFAPLTRPLADVLKENGVECLDLVGRFRQRAGRGAKLYFEIDGHPNETGNQLVAEVVGERLREMLAQPGRPAG